MNGEQTSSPAEGAAGATGVTPEQVVALIQAHLEARAADNAPLPAGMLVGLKTEDPKWEVMVNRNGQIELVRFRRPDEFLQQEALKWTWEGRALSSANAQSK
jgi:outer membrane usher protein FimD/PapC